MILLFVESSIRLLVSNTFLVCCIKCAEQNQHGDQTFFLLEFPPLNVEVTQ